MSFNTVELTSKQGLFFLFCMAWASCSSNQQLLASQNLFVIIIQCMYVCEVGRGKFNCQLNSNKKEVLLVHHVGLGGTNAPKSSVHSLVWEQFPEPGAAVS